MFFVVLLHFSQLSLPLATPLLGLSPPTSIPVALSGRRPTFFVPERLNLVRADFRENAVERSRNLFPFNMFYLFLSLHA